MSTDLAARIAALPCAEMRDALAAQEPGFAAEMLDLWDDAGADGRADIEAFFLSDGPRLVHEVKLRHTDGVPTSADLEQAYSTPAYMAPEQGGCREAVVIGGLCLGASAPQRWPCWRWTRSGGCSVAEPPFVVGDFDDAYAPGVWATCRGPLEVYADQDRHPLRPVDEPREPVGYCSRECRAAAECSCGQVVNWWAATHTPGSPAVVQVVECSPCRALREVA